MAVSFFFDLSDAVAVFVMLIAGGSIYLSYDMTRIMKGAPRAWYVVILAFCIRFLYTAYQTYQDLQTPADTLGLEPTFVSLAFQISIFTGLLMLHQDFVKVKRTKEEEEKR